MQKILQGCSAKRERLSMIGQPCDSQISIRASYILVLNTTAYAKARPSCKRPRLLRSWLFNIHILRLKPRRVCHTMPSVFRKEKKGSGPACSPKFYQSLLISASNWRLIWILRTRVNPEFFLVASLLTTMTSLVSAGDLFHLGRFAWNLWEIGFSKAKDAGK